MDYLQRSLKIKKKASLDIGSDVNVATTLNNTGMCFKDMHKPANNIGLCLIKMQKPADALDYVQRIAENL